MKKITLLLTIFSTLIIQAQTLKTYEGGYLLKEVQGHTVYNYYEDANGERVLNGAFKMHDYEIDITGSYKQNKKNGNWKILLKRSVGDELATITGEFANDKMNGTWTYTCYSNLEKKLLVRTTAHFKDDLMIGKYEYSETDYIKIEINFNNEGYYDGIYDIKFLNNHIPYEDYRIYKNGEATYVNNKNLSTGKMYEGWDKSEYINYALTQRIELGIEFWNCPFTQNCSNCVVNRLCEVVDRKTNEELIAIKRDSLLEQRNAEIKTEVYNEYIRIGDSLTVLQKYSDAILQYQYALRVKEGAYIQDKITACQARIREINYKTILLTADSFLFARNFKQAIEKYKEALTIRDDPYPKKKIQEAESEIAEQNSKYEANLKEANIAFSNGQYEKAIVSYQKALEYKNEAFPISRIDSAKAMLTFLKERTYKTYSLKEVNKHLFDSINSAFQNFALAELQGKVSSYKFEGILTVTVDTNGRINSEFVATGDRQDKLKKEISNFISKIKFPVQKVKGYTINTQLKLPVKITSGKGQTEYKLGAKGVEFIYSAPEPEVINYLNKKHQDNYFFSGSVKEKYNFLSVNDTIIIKETQTY